MSKQVYEYSYAGHWLRYIFTKPETRYFFRPIPRRAEGDAYDLCVSQQDYDHFRHKVPPEASPSYTEYRALICPTAQALLRYDCCILHAAAFSWRGSAWLLAAPSGTGKTTQYLNWQRLFPAEISMISGDMPVIELLNGTILVHPSPWNGKERLKGAPSAPLGGIILLEQGSVNSIDRVGSGDMIIPLSLHLMARPEDEQDCIVISRILDALLRNTPSWKLVNLGDDASTRLLRSALAGSLDGEEQK